MECFVLSEVANMKMKKLLTCGLAFGAGIVLMGASPASADVSSEGEAVNVAEASEATESSEDLDDSEVALLKDAAAAGDAKAQLVVGVLHLEGSNGFAKDSDKALYWLTQAAQQNEVDALAMLGAIYLYGEQVAQDYELANQYLRKAAQKGHPASQYVYAMMCAAGLGREVNAEEAKVWMNASADNGDEDANAFLDEHPDWLE